MSLSRVRTIARREFRAYFATPLAAVFLVIFLFLAAFMTFNVGGLYDRGQADLRPFFQFHPWLYLFLVPAISMRLWAEERRTGTIELLTTLPFTISDLVVGKFVAAWAFAAVALLLTLPVWITVAWLGNPDHGVIAVGYLASLLMAGSFLAIGGCLSAFTKNQVIAFVLCAVVSFVVLLAGFPAVLDLARSWLPPTLGEPLAQALASVSALTHFDSMMRGVIDIRDVFYFLSMIAAFLYLTVIVVDWRKAD